MRITELAEIITTGRKVDSGDITSSPTTVLYIQPSNIERGLAISEGNAKYIIEKTYRNYQTKPIQVEYGDFLIFRKMHEPSYSMLRITQDFGKKRIVPSNNFIIIKNPQAFLSVFLQHEAGKLYFLKEIDDIMNRTGGNFIEVSKQLRFIDIDPIILEQLKIDNYISPGNTPISTEDLSKINVRGDVITIDNIYKRLKENEIRLEGYFQRKSNLWADDVKSRLIETIILNMPVPPLFFDITNDDKWLIVDGLQRISAIKSFYANELELINLDYMPELQGKRFKDLDRPLQRRFEEKQMSYFAIYPGTPRSVRYKIFKNINVTALVLNRQEIRHAINEDEDAEFTPSKYLQSLAPILNSNIALSEKGERGKERMFDLELCLRYISFRILNHIFDYNGSIQDFLDKAMERIYSYERNKLNVFKIDFEQTLKTILNMFPADTAFTRAMISNEAIKTFNANLFGVWTYIISRLSDEERAKLIANKAAFKEKSKELSKDPDYDKAIDPRYFETIESLKTHIDKTEKFIKKFLND